VGTFQLSNASGNILQAWDPKAVKPAGARCCWGVSADVGTITITSLTKTRAKGTFSATLSPQPGTAAVTIGPLTITNGSFDIGLFHTPLVGLRTTPPRGNAVVNIESRLAVARVVY